MNEVTAERTGNPDMAKIIYVLYLIGLVTGLTILVGVVMAYIYKDDSPEWLRTHYESQIRLFWMGILYCIVATLLIFVLIGFLLYLVIAIWWIVRCVKGLTHLDQRTAYPDYQSWAFCGGIYCRSEWTIMRVRPNGVPAVERQRLRPVQDRYRAIELPHDGPDDRRVPIHSRGRGARPARAGRACHRRSLWLARADG